MIDKERLRAEMERQGVTQAMLAKAAEVSAASIQQILNGTVKQPRSLRKIAYALGVSHDWLEGLTDEPDRKFTVDILPDDLDPVYVQYFTTEFERPANEKSSEVAQRVLVFSKSWIRSIAPDNSDSEVIMFRYSAKDMAPNILPGDDVLIAGSNHFDGDNGSLWMFLYSRKSMVRRVKSSTSGLLELTADNPLTPPLQVEVSEISFIGKLIWQGRSLIP